MEEDFLYLEKGCEIGIKGYQGEECKVLIPDFYEGKPVTELLAYAFYNCRYIWEVQLPKGIEKIGEHCFFDCRNLVKIGLYDGVKVIEDGFIKNCYSLREIEIFAEKCNFYGLKSILEEIREEVRVTLYLGEEKERVSLVFPRFLHDYEENTQARIINEVTYGCGVHYRECVKEKGIDFKKYDGLFAFVMANEGVETVLYIVILRLRFPYGLEKEEKGKYLEYVKENYAEIGTHLLKMQDMENLQFLVELNVVKREWMDKFLGIARELGEVEYVSFLLGEKRKRFGECEKKFEL